MQLLVSHDTFDEAVVVQVKGEIDASNGEELVSRLKTAVGMASAHPSRLLVVDLQEVTFFGSAGLNAVLGCHELGTKQGTEVRMVATQPEVLRPIEVTKLDHVLKLCSTLTEATAPPDRS